MSRAWIYGDEGDPVSVELTSLQRYQVRIGDMYLHLHPDVARRVLAALHDALAEQDGGGEIDDHR